MSESIINIGIRLDAAGAVQGVTIADQAFKRLDDTVKKSNQTMSATEAVWKRVQNLAAGYLGFQALERVTHRWVEEVTQAEQASFRLEAVLKATGNSAGLTGVEIGRMADTLGKQTLFEDDQFVEAAGRLATFRSVTGDTFREVLSLSADLATLMGTDVTNATTLIGKALESPVEGLRQLRVAGVSFNDEAKKMIDNMVNAGNKAGAQRLILDQLTASIGGVAAGSNQGLSGAIRHADEAWGNFLEHLGEDATTNQPGLLTSTLEFWADFFERHTNEHDPIQARIDRLVELQQTIDDLKGPAQAVQNVLDSGLVDNANVDTTPIVKRNQALAEQKRLIAEVTALNLQSARAHANAQNSAAATVAATPPQVDPTRQRDVDAITKSADAARMEADTFGMSDRAKAKYIATTQGATAAELEALDKTYRQIEAKQRQQAAQELLNKVMDEGVRGQQETAATLGMTNDQLLVYRARQAGATDVQVAAIESASALIRIRQQEIDQQKALNDAIEAARQAEENRGKSIADTFDTLRRQAELEERIAKASPGEESRIRAEQAIIDKGGSQADAKVAGDYQTRIDAAKKAQEASRTAREETEKDTKLWEEAWTQAARNIQDSVADVFFQMFTESKLTVDKMVENILRSIAQIGSQLAAAGLIKIATTFITDLATHGAASAAPVGGGTPTVSTNGGAMTAKGPVFEEPAAGSQVPEATVPAPARALAARPLEARGPALDTVGPLTPSIFAEAEMPTPARARAVGAGVGAGAGTGEGPMVVHQHISFDFSAIDANGMKALLQQQKGTIAEIVARSAQESRGFLRQLQGVR